MNPSHRLLTCLLAATRSVAAGKSIQPISPEHTLIRGPVAARLLQTRIEAHDYQRAITPFPETTKLDPRLAEVYLCRASAKLRIGELEAGVARHAWSPQWEGRKVP